MHIHLQDKSILVFALCFSNLYLALNYCFMFKIRYFMLNVHCTVLSLVCNHLTWGWVDKFSVFMLSRGNDDCRTSCWHLHVLSLCCPPVFLEMVPSILLQIQGSIHDVDVHESGRASWILPKSVSIVYAAIWRDIIIRVEHVSIKPHIAFKAHKIVFLILINSK